MTSSPQRDSQVVSSPTHVAAGPVVVYVAGSSFSGSTMLGLVLGTDPRGLFLGELKQIARISSRDSLGGKYWQVCTCGEASEACPFWSAVLDRYPSDVDLNPAPGFSLANMRLLLRIVSPFPLRWRRRGMMGYASLINAASEVARDQKPGLEFVVDGSKSLRGLDALAHSPGLHLAVVHVVRDCLGVADSYKERGRSSLYGALAWGAVNVVLRYYVWRRGIPALLVGYEALCRSPERELARLNRFLGTTLVSDEVMERVRREPYHLFSGNLSVRGEIRDFAGIVYHSDRGHLSRFERLAAIGVGRLVRRLLRAQDRGDR